MFDQSDTPEEGVIRPNFDGRLQYHKILGSHMIEISRAQSTGDLYSWMRLMFGYYALIKPYCKLEEIKDTYSKMKSIREDMNNVRLTKNSQKLWKYKSIQFDSILLDLTEELYFAARHLLLTTNSDSMGEFTEDEFLKQSDL